MDTDSVAAIDFLSRSDTRVRLLRYLARETQSSKQELHTIVDASRTTLQRNLAALENKGWITSTDREYEITTAGEWVAEDFVTLVETVDRATQLGPLFELVDTSMFEFDPRRVDVSVTTSDPGQPQKMIQEHIRSINAATDICLLLPETAIQPLRATHERVLDKEMSATLIVSERVLDTFRSTAEAQEYIAAMQQTGRFRVLLTDTEIPFYLGRLDETVEIGISENNQPRALLSTTDAAVRDWAERTLADYESTATPTPI